MLDALDIKDKFAEISSSKGNYSAIMDIARKARYLQNSCDNQITEGQAIKWALTGVEPEKSKIYRFLKSCNQNIHYTLKYVMSITDDVLSGVDDEGICKSVRASVKASNQSKKEQFIYIDIESEGQHSRVRILTRMILDQL